MLESDEYLRRNGNTPEGLVRGLFRDVYAQANPSPRDVGMWTNILLQSGSRADMIEQLLQGVDVFNPPPRPAVPVTPAPAPQYAPPAYAPPAYAPPAPQYTLPAPPPWNGRYEREQRRVPPYRYIPYPR